jgi:hypothetical protein
MGMLSKCFEMDMESWRDTELKILYFIALCVVVLAFILTLVAIFIAKGLGIL